VNSAEVNIMLRTLKFLGRFFCGLEYVLGVNFYGSNLVIYDGKFLERYIVWIGDVNKPGFTAIIHGSITLAGHASGLCLSFRPIEVS
jgi:hypothetical protein